jgi:hypothetical protein
MIRAKFVAWHSLFENGGLRTRHRKGCQSLFLLPPQKIITFSNQAAMLPHLPPVPVPLRRVLFILILTEPFFYYSRPGLFLPIFLSFTIFITTPYL